MEQKAEKPEGSGAGEKQKENLLLTKRTKVLDRLPEVCNERSEPSLEIIRKKISTSVAGEKFIYSDRYVMKVIKGKQMFILKGIKTSTPALVDVASVTDDTKSVMLCEANDMLYRNDYFSLEHYVASIAGEFSQHFAKPLFIDRAAYFGDAGKMDIYAESLQEYAGMDLEKISKKGNINIREVFSWMLQSAIALAALHALGICHLDVKPENMAYDPVTEILKIIDLGSCVGCSKKDKVDTTASHPREKVRESTWLFSPPEVARLIESASVYMELANKYGQLILGAVDTYCWGITFLYLLSGNEKMNFLKERAADEICKRGNASQYEKFHEKIRRRASTQNFDGDEGNAIRTFIVDLAMECTIFCPKDRPKFSKIFERLQSFATSHGLCGKYIEKYGKINEETLKFIHEKDILKEKASAPQHETKFMRNLQTFRPSNNKHVSLAKTVSEVAREEEKLELQGGDSEYAPIRVPVFLQYNSRMTCPTNNGSGNKIEYNKRKLLKSGSLNGKKMYEPIDKEALKENDYYGIVTTFDNTFIGFHDNTISYIDAAAIFLSLKSKIYITSVSLKGNKLGDKEVWYIKDELKENTSLKTLSLCQNQIGPEGAADIAWVIRLNATLQELDLSDNNIKDLGAVALAQALENNDTLHKLKLSTTNIGLAGSEAIANMLMNNNSLQELDMSNNDIKDKGITLISEGLTHNRMLVNLSLGRCNIGDEGAVNLFGILRNENKSLAELDLNCNSIGAASSREISSDIAYNHALRKLNLFGNNLGAEGAANIAQGVSTNRMLITFNIGQNKIGKEGAIAMSTVLHLNPTLTTLNLGSNQIGMDGASAIASKLRSNTTLERLELNDNDITDTGVQVIAGAIAGNSHLKVLNLHGNNTACWGAKGMSDALRSNTALTTLDLGANKIEYIGTIAIAELIKENKTLITLDLSDNSGIGEKGTEKLVVALQENKTLKTLLQGGRNLAEIRKSESFLERVFSW
ncbi:MAG: hypothetical protein P4M11_14525 [Candidatus Pacebacteria bacterium]|nr:hypothetical protein [Candidatus Paceibacterota bacterium]